MKWLASIGLSGTVLALFAAITSVAIGWTYLGTKAQIDFEVRRAEARQLLEIFPPGTHDNEIVDDVFEVAAETALLGIRETRQGYRVRQGNTVIGVILPTTARDGYSGDIRALVGVRRDGSVAGVRVVAHRETPGLGDKVDLRKSDWILDFNERSLDQPGTGRLERRKRRRRVRSIYGRNGHPPRRHPRHAPGTRIRYPERGNPF